jgi:hypothetical protein
MGIQQGIEGSHNIHFTITSQTNKTNIPLKETTQANPYQPQHAQPSHKQCHIKLEMLP